MGGVKVFIDTNGDGVWRSGELFAITAPDGSWLITGLTPGATYSVVVDTATLPGGYNPIPTNWGGQPASIDVDMPPGGSDVLYADFVFDGGTPATIGDTIYLDVNGNGAQDPGEPGIPGVTVNLIDGGGNIIATAVTDGNGNYQFTGVPDGTYSVQVTDVSNVLLGLNESDDPDATLDEQTTVVVSGGVVTSIGGVPCVGCDNNVDFGYAPATGTIGNQIWHDVNGNGLYEPKGTDGIPGTLDDESGLEGITVALWLDVNGNGIIEPGTDNLLRTTTTDVNGQYEFKGLEAGKYLVDVTDKAGVLSGFTKTTGPTPGAENNSQTDPYPVTLTSAAPSNYTADFGYKATAPHSISGTVFNDANASGSTVPHPETGEPGAPSVQVLLFRDLNGDGVLDPGEPLIGTTVTVTNGHYTFADLPDGDYIVMVNGVGTSIDGWFQTTQQATPQPALQPVTLSGADSTDNDFGFNAPKAGPTAVVLLSFSATWQDSAVLVSWKTASEVDNSGFNLRRAESIDGPKAMINAALIPSQVPPGSPGGASYQLLDQGVQVGSTYYYWLEAVDIRGGTTPYGPVSNKESRISANLNLGDHRTSAVRLLGLDSLRSQIQAPTAGFGPPFGRRRERQGAHRNHIENC